MSALVSFLLVASLLLHAPADQSRLLPPLTVKVSSTVCMSPCTLRVTIHFERDDDNDHINIWLEGDDYTRTSEEPIAERHPKTFIVNYYDVPAGDYVLTVSLVRRSKRAFVETRTLQIV